MAANSCRLENRSLKLPSINVFLIIALFWAPLAFGSTETGPSLILLGLLMTGTVFELFRKSAGSTLPESVKPAIRIAFIAAVGFLALVVLQISFPSVHHTSNIPVPEDGVLKPLWRPGTLMPYAGRLYLLKIAIFVNVFLLTLLTVNSEKRLVQLTTGIIVLGVLSSVIALAQKITGAAGIYWVRPISGDFRDFYGSFINRNHYACFTAMILPVNLGFLFYCLSKKRENPHYSRIIPFVLGSMILTFAALLPSGSSGGLVAVFFGLTVCLLWLRRKEPGAGRMTGRGLAVLFLLFCMVIVGYSAVQENNGASISAEGPQEAGTSLSRRISLWQSTVNAVRDYPLFGFGPGAFPDAFRRYAPATPGKVWSHAHNDYLEIAAENGLIGFILIIAAFAVFIGAIGPRRRNLEKFQLFLQPVKGIWTGFIAAVSVMLLHSLAEFNFQINANLFFFGLCLAGGAAAFRLMGSSRSSNSAMNSLKVKALLATVLSIIPAVAAFRHAAAEQILEVRETGVSVSLLTDFVLNDYDVDSPVLLERAKSWAPGWAKLEYLRASSSPDRQRSISYLKKAVDKNICRARYRQSLAWELKNSGNWDAAAVSMKNAVILEPNSIYRLRAYAYFCLERAFEAADERKSDELMECALSNAAQVVSHSPEFLNEFLQSFARQTTQFSELVQLIPDNYDQGIYALVVFLITNELWEQNKTQYALAAEQAEPDRYWHYIKGWAETYIHQRKYLDAYQLIESYLEEHPKNADAYFKLADLAFYRLQDKKAALENNATACSLEPRNTYYRFWYGKMFYWLHDYDAAIRQFKRVVRLEPDNKEAKIWANRCREKMNYSRANKPGEDNSSSKT